jgi:hypothetical protein
VAGDGVCDGDAHADEIYDLLTENGLAISELEDWLNGHSPTARNDFADQLRSRQQNCFLAHP